mmetsp:Transcript_138837/g.241429  ORF Transcript_138837/g.241429 Transcript_138837/m.241429 type:complete len:132 (-) Transcript_138837:1206-1601(-)
MSHRVKARSSSISGTVVSITTGSACLACPFWVLEGRSAFQGIAMMRRSLVHKVPADLQLLSMATYNLMAAALLGFTSRWRTLTQGLSFCEVLGNHSCLPPLLGLLQGLLLKNSGCGFRNCPCYQSMLPGTD